MEGNLPAVDCSGEAPAKSPPLIPYIIRNAPVSIPDDFATGFVDCDRTLNDWRRGRESHESE